LETLTMTGLLLALLLGAPLDEAPKAPMPAPAAQGSAPAAPALATQRPEWIVVDAFGIAHARTGTLVTELSPEELYKLAGRPELVARAASRARTRTGLAVAGIATFYAGLLTLVIPAGIFVWRLTHLSCPTGNCDDHAPVVYPGGGGLALVGAGVTLTGVALGGAALGLPADPTDPAERAAVVSKYNAQAAGPGSSLESATPAGSARLTSSLIETLRFGPLLAGPEGSRAARGAVVGISF
jgi:hypothetical protein